MNKRILFLLLCLIAMLSVSAVSAVDDNVTEDNLNMDVVSSEDTSYISQDSDLNTVASENLSSEDTFYINQDSDIASNNFSSNVYESGFQQVSFKSDVVDNSVDDNGTFTDLQNLINNASSGDTITLDKNYVYNNNIDKNGITISKSLTINGNNYLIDGKHGRELFKISASYVTLNNLTLKNFNSAITWSGLCGTLSNSTITLNGGYSYSTKYGGAIYWTGDVGTIINCDFDSNNLYGSGYGGAIYMSGSYNKIINSKFHANSAKFGGAIHWNSTKSSIVNCIFKNNVATDDTIPFAGAIYWEGESCRILNSTFDFNHVTLGKTGFGGAIAYHGKLGYISNCIFNENNACAGQGGAIILEGTNCTIVNCNFTNNNASSGGAIYGGSYEILNCIFLRNHANQGGVMYGAGKSIVNSTLMENYANQGGAIYVESNAVNITDCNIHNNRANFGGAIYCTNIWGIIENSCFTNNSAKFGSAMYGTNYNLLINNSKFLDNQAESDSLEISTEITGYGRNITLNAVFKGKNDMINALYGDKWRLSNVTYWGANGITMGYGSRQSTLEAGQNITFEIWQQDTLIKNVTVRTNYNGVASVNISGLFGGTYSLKAYHQNDTYYTSVSATSISFNISLIDIYVNSSAPNKGNGTFEHPFQKFDDAVKWITHGSTLYLANGTYESNDSNILFNNVKLIPWGQGTPIIESVGKKILLSVKGDNVEIFGMIFKAGSSLNRLGHIFWKGNNGFVANCTFINNVASDNGGAISLIGNNGFIINCTFINNTASDNGGAISLSGNKHEIINCSFINNTVNGTPMTSNKFGNGGAIYLSGDDIKVLNSIFTNNSAHWSTIGGGAVYIDGNNGYMSNCSFLNNYVGYKGFGAICWNGGDGKLLNCSFTNNTAGFQGSGIRWDGANGLVANSNFTNNSRNVVYWMGDNGRLFNSNFINSTDADEGAALYWSGDNGDIDTCTFVNNTAESSGGAVYFFENNNTNIKNCIFSNNTAKGGVWWNDGLGGAIYIVSNYNYFLNIGIVNCTFEENSAPSGSAIYTRSNKLTIADSIILNNSAEFKLLNLTPDYNNQLLDIILKGGNNLVNGIYAVNDVIFTNVTYYGINGITKTGNDVILEKGDYASNQKIFVEVYNDLSILVKNSTVKTDDVGHAVLNLNDLDPGTYNVKVYCKDNTYYTNISNTTTFIVKKDPTIKIEVEDIIYGDRAFIKITFLKRVGGNVTIKVANETYIQNISYYTGGTGLYIENLDAGEYNVEVTYNGNAIYNSYTNTTKFNVFKQSTCMNVSVEDISVGYSAYVYVNVNNWGVEDVATIYINDVEYETINLTRGYGGLAIPDLKAGIYKITAKFNGSKNYNMSVNSTGFVVFGYFINVPDVIKYYKGYEKLIANVTNIYGSVYGVNVTFSINGNNYIRETDFNGIASMNINLGPGTYKVITTCNNTSVNSTIVVKSTIGANDLVKLYQNGTQFYAKFLDNTGKVLANTDVRFNINGVFYTRTTGDDGVAKLSINLNPGKYILTAINPINGEQSGYNVTVKSLAEANDLTKYYKNESKFESKIYNKDGSLAINKEVKFNINGVFYTRTTDENGIARLGINLRPGDYVITTIVDGLESGNNVKVLPTLLANDLNMNFQDGSKFSTTILNGQGVPLPNQNVTFNVNGVFYNRVSNGDGVASLAINLLRGEYIITSMWNDYQVGNKITIS